MGDLHNDGIKNQQQSSWFGKVTGLFFGAKKTPPSQDDPQNTPKKQPILENSEESESPPARNIRRGKRPREMDFSRSDSESQESKNIKSSKKKSKTSTQDYNSDNDAIHMIQEPEPIPENKSTAAAKRAAKKASATSSKSNKKPLKTVPIPEKDSKTAVSNQKATSASQADTKQLQNKKPQRNQTSQKSTQSVSSSSNHTSNNTSNKQTKSSNHSLNDYSDDAGSESQSESDFEESANEVSEDDELSNSADVSIKWPLNPTKMDGDTQYFAWVEIDGFRVNRGDSVYLRSGSEKDYIAKIVEIIKNDDSVPMCRVQWWFQKGDLKGVDMSSKELLESEDTEVNPLASIRTSSQPTILFGNDQKNIAQCSRDPDCFFYYRFWNHLNKKIQIL